MTVTTSSLSRARGRKCKGCNVLYMFGAGYFHQTGCKEAWKDEHRVCRNHNEWPDEDEVEPEFLCDGYFTPNREDQYYCPCCELRRLRGGKP